MAQTRYPNNDTSDAFSDMPERKSTPDKSTHINHVVNKNTGSRDVNIDTKSSGYTVKKITSSYQSGSKPDTKITGLNTISIDTESFTNPSKADAPVLSKISIETESFSEKDISVANNSYPLIIDETDHDETIVQQPPQPVSIKKEKTPPKEQNITIDISSTFCNPQLPSDTNQETLGTGKVVSVLGTGGMARVYKIWNEKLEIYRAVKILLPTNQRELWDRFLTEAKITAKLHHPNIIETYDTGEWHGLPTIEMELIDGDTVSALLSVHPMIPSPVCASIAVQVARALSYAHSQKILIYGREYNGIIHRDLKPSNIMVTNAGNVKLMDFGVARPIETGLHTISTDSIVGTIHYFSPEQISGYPIDTLSDIYSFGAVLYELICGQNPFPHSNMVTMIQAKTKNQFKRLEEYHQKVDDRLSSVAQTCMRTDKRERFASLDIVRKILEDILSSYNMGTPEEIIATFYRDPQQIQIAFEQFHTNRIQAALKAPIPQPQRQTSSLDIKNHQPEMQTYKSSQSVSEQCMESTEWEIKKSGNAKTLIVAAIILILAVTGGSYFLKSKSDKTDSIITIEQQDAIIDNTNN